MKRIAAIGFVALAVAIAPVARAQDFTYTTNSGAITITGYTGPGGEDTIPDTINSLPVTGIAGSAFHNTSTLTSIFVPTSVTDFGRNAFDTCGGSPCASLNVTIYASGTNTSFAPKLDNSGFQTYNDGLQDLTSITLSNGITRIERYAFLFCSKLNSILIPASVTYFGTSAFGTCNYGTQCTNLSVTIYASGTNTSFGPIIDNNGFPSNNGIQSLTSITLSNGITRIEAYAFLFCDKLNSILIPASVTYFGFSAFGTCNYATQCTNLSVTVYASGTNTSFGPTYNNGVQGLTSITLSNGITRLESSAFYGCFKLKSLLIPASVTNIGSQVFNYCDVLTAINVAASNAFYSSVDGVLFNKDLSVLIQTPGAKAGSYTVPSSVTSVGDYAFFNCTGLTNLYFAGNAPSLGLSVFQGDSLTIYYLPLMTGWSSTFGGRPAVLWNPQAQNMAIANNQLGFTITGSSNLVIVVEACTNLVSPVWIPLKTNTLTGGASSFTDSNSASYPRRFYRFRSP